MSKRIRDTDDTDDTNTLDPAVKAVIEGYESNLAQFMDSLSSLLERYNGLLQAALPHNPKAVFYYQQPDEVAAAAPAAEATATDNATAAAPAAVAATPTSTVGAGFPAVTPGVGERRAPTSPLLRRPQLPAQQLEELKLEAKAELERRTSSFAFPTAAELAKDAAAARSPELKSKKTPSRGPSAEPSSAAAVALGTTVVGATAAASQPSAAAAAAPAPAHPLGIRTTLNKILDKKAVKELVKKVKEEVAANEAEENDNANTAAAEKKDGEEATAAAPAPALSEEEAAKKTAADAATNGQAASTVATIATELCTRTVAEVLADVEIPPMLLAQLRVLKKESQALMYTFDQIHDWIAMKAPAMNESDNQGVAIMASVISVISSIMSSLQDLFDMEKEYINKRGQLECQYVPNFECATIKDLIAATDANKWDDIEVGWRTMMRAVIIVHSRLAMNMKTLRTPREKRVHHLSM